MIKNGDITLQQLEKKQDDFKSKLGLIKLGNPKYKNEKQKNTIENIKNLYNSKQKLLIYSIIIQELHLKQFTKQNKTELKVQDFKY